MNGFSRSHPRTGFRFPYLFGPTVRVRLTPSVFAKEPNLQTTMNEIINALNAGIAAFNDRDYVAARRHFRQAIELAKKSALEPDVYAPYMASIRAGAMLANARDLVVEIDRLLKPVIGDGMVQFSPDIDQAVRRKTNDIISAANDGQTNDCRAALEDMISRQDGIGALTHHTLDCVEALAETASRIGDESMSRTFAGFRSRLACQRDILESNRQTLGSVNKQAIDFPDVVTIETFMKCNAACHFCPYPDMAETSPRADLRMSEELFEKIIGDLEDIPPYWAFEINLSRVNEPLLDHRLFSFMETIRDRLPNARIFIPTNGTTLTDKNIDRLASISTFYKLTVSLNADNKEQYEDIMQLPFDRTLANIDRLHTKKTAGEIPFNVVLTAVMPRGAAYDHFTAFCKGRYPEFHVDQYTPSNWFGATDNETYPAATIPVGCKDWYQVHILANGQEAQCCFDNEGKLGHANVRDMHMLEIYNKPWQRQLRRRGLTRHSPEAPEFCRNCDYM